MKWIIEKTLTTTKYILLVILAFIVVEIVLSLGSLLGPGTAPHHGEMHPFMAIIYAPIYLFKTLTEFLVSALFTVGFIGLCLYFIQKNKSSRHQNIKTRNKHNKAINADTKPHA